MENERITKGIIGTYRVLIVLCVLIVIISIVGLYFFEKKDSKFIAIPEEEIGQSEVANGIHLATGFIEAPGMQETIANCTTCHSSQLVIQNRMSKQAWHATIDWMQETQNLWPLGDNEEIIIDYLVKNYPPTKKGRRITLQVEEWYELTE